MSVLGILGLAGCGGGGAPAEPAALVSRGWDYYRLGEFTAAIEAFHRAELGTAEAAPEHLRALYGQAVSWHLRRPGEDLARAQDLYERVIALAPESDLAAWSLLALARMKHVVPVGQEPDYDAVRAAYREVTERFPGHLAGQEAFVHTQASLLLEESEARFREVLAATREFVATYPDSPFRSVVHEMMSHCYGELERPEEQLDARIDALEAAETDPTNPWSSKVMDYWYIAVIAEFEVGDFDTARAYYAKLIEEYPADIHKFPAEQALTRMDAVEARLRQELRGDTPP
ncbi:MAG: tetratricopeptide repeat protein [Candidatus Hydrogenedentes bacterium]|nr:tetratricopeptide repeat protein [Candidatus Hydrogenedentota bacterium]